MKLAQTVRPVYSVSTRVTRSDTAALCTRVSYLALQTHLKAPHMHAASVNMNSFHPHCIAYLLHRPLQPVSLHHRTRFSRHPSLIPPSNPFCLRFRARTHRCHRGFYLDSRVQHFTWRGRLPFLHSHLSSPCLSTRFLFDPLRRMLLS